MPQHDQYLRYVKLTVLQPPTIVPIANPVAQPPPSILGQGELHFEVHPIQFEDRWRTGIDLSQFRIEFEITQSDFETPNNAIIRVYNLSDDTAVKVNKEFSQVTLEAGYQGNHGTIFFGDIKQVRRGRTSPTETYLDILAADGDSAYSFSVISRSRRAGATAQDELNDAAGALGVPLGYIPDLPRDATARGQVKFGMTAAALRDFANTYQMTWSIQNGKLQLVPRTSFKPGEAVVINRETGMIGLPEQTTGGIYVTTLLNPKLSIGGLIKLDNKSIQRAFLGDKNLFIPNQPDKPGPAGVPPGLLPRISDDGLYRVYVVNYKGDSRGLDWYSKITALALIKPDGPSCVAAYG